jgi:hypothetical protein
MAVCTSPKQELQPAPARRRAAVPEPETYALMLVGVGAIGFLRRRRMR